MPNLGIDIGGSSVKAALLESGQLAWTGQSGTYCKPTASHLIAALVDAIHGRIGGKEGLKVGLCAPGVLDPIQRRITTAVNVPGLTELTLDDLVTQAVGNGAKLSWIGSDAVASACDAAKTKKLTGRVFSLAIGTGVGAAVLDDGKPLLVSGNSPGHWGQVDVSLPGEEVIGPDGGAGGLEGYIGAAALRKRYGQDLPSAVAKMSANEPPIKALVRAIRIGHAIYRPQHVLLLGGIGIHLAHLQKDIHRMVSENLTSVARAGWTLDVGEDTWHAARGSALLAE
ncbi:MAG TPA: ROK family protein [Tepidisphaeraceae bacterium]|jgi:predicted NBD/HSP70 family sugar kinase